MIASELRRMCLIKELLEQGTREDEIASKLGMHPYVVKLKTQASKKFSLRALKEALVSVAHINTNMRSGIRSTNRAFERIEEVVIKLLEA